LVLKGEGGGGAECARERKKKVLSIALGQKKKQTGARKCVGQSGAGNRVCLKGGREVAVRTERVAEGCDWAKQKRRGTVSRLRGGNRGKIRGHLDRGTKRGGLGSKKNWGMMQLESENECAGLNISTLKGGEGGRDWKGEEN